MLKNLETTTTLESFRNNTEKLRQARLVQQQELNNLQSSLLKMEQGAKELLSYINIHDTIKGYTSIGQYDRNTKGLSGASFGSNILEQLSILQTTASNLLSIQDINWLLFAILNCGTQAIGSSHKSELEDYFSSLVGYLMFNDAELLVEDVINNVKITKSHNQITDIHVYNINGIYIPNSFILEQTYNALTKVSNDLTNVNNIGIKATINTYNGGPVNQDSKQLEISDWQATSNAALDVTKIKMTFLAGFFDILNKLADAVGQHL